MSLPQNALHGNLHPEVQAHLHGLVQHDDALLDRLEAYGRERDFPIVGRSSGRVLELCARAIGARRVFELGSGFGFSAWFFARAVGPEGRVYCTDRDEHERVAFRELYAEHPLATRIEHHVGDALEVLATTPGEFDCIFIDVMKEDYPRTVEAALPRLRRGGLLLIDNLLWGGRAARPVELEDHATAGVVEVTRLLMTDPKLCAMVLPIGDGLGVALKLE